MTMAADIRLIQRSKVLKTFVLVFLLFNIYIGGLQDLIELIVCSRNLSSVVILWSKIALCGTFLYWSSSALLRERLSVLFLSNLAAWSVGAGRSVMTVALFFATCGSAGHLCTARSSGAWKAELWKALPTDRLTTFWTTLISFKSQPDSVALPSLPSSRRTASCTEAGIVAIWSHTLFSSRSDKWNWTDQSSEWGNISTRAYLISQPNVSPPSTLTTTVDISPIAASNNGIVIGKFPMDVAVHNAAGARLNNTNYSQNSIQLLHVPSCRKTWSARTVSSSVRYSAYNNKCLDDTCITVFRSHALSTWYWL